RALPGCFSLYPECSGLQSLGECLKGYPARPASGLNDHLALTAEQLPPVTSRKVLVRLMAAGIAVSDADDGSIPLDFEPDQTFGGGDLPPFAIEGIHFDDTDILPVGTDG